MKQPVDLEGVPETLLWPLYNRASFARRPGALLHDPKSIEIFDSIDYEFARYFGRPNEAQVLRALRFDEEVRRFMSRHPDGTVVGLAEGLETGFWRLDNGRIRWLAVDLPESIAVRSRWLKDTSRHRNLACSALDFRWMDQVDASQGVCITAEGLLMYLAPQDVHRLIAACADRFPGAVMIFDTIPVWLSQKTLRGLKLTRHYQTPPMPWGLDPVDLHDLKRIHPNIVDVHGRKFWPGQTFLFRVVIPFMERLPLPASMRDKYPMLVVMRFGST